MTNPQNPAPAPNTVVRRTFPILNGNGARIDYQLVADHGGQAQKNHYQSVERLAQRGGLSWSELHAVLHERSFQKIDQNTAIIECRALEARYLAVIHTPSPAPNVLVDAAKGLKRIVEEIDGTMKHGTWRDDKGNRLKDTAEWVALYNAISDASHDQQ